MCPWLVAGSYAVGLFHSFTHTIFTFTLSFCGSNKVNNYFCDIPPLLKLSCSDTHFYEMVIFALVSINCVTTTMTIFTSYSCILIASWLAPQRVGVKPFPPVVPTWLWCHLLWDNFLHVSTTNLYLHSGSKQGGLFVLHSDDPYAESHDLCLEESRSEMCSSKND